MSHPHDKRMLNQSSVLLIVFTVFDISCLLYLWEQASVFSVFVPIFPSPEVVCGEAASGRLGGD